MKTRGRQKARGMALIMAMIAIFVLSALAAGFALSMKVETRLAQNADSESQLLWLGRAGVDYCQWVLAQQKCPFDSLNQVWAGGPGSECDTNIPVKNPVEVEDGTFTWKIIDLERKANINTANAAAIQQALTLMGVDASEISVVSDSILDWIDPGDDPGLGGAESDYYQGLAVPYYAKNAPIDDLSELLLVKGVTPEMYWGSNSTNHIPSVFQHKLGLGHAPGQTPNYPFGLVDLFTPISGGRININTADANVLQMIPGVDAATAENIIKQRAGPDGVEGTEDDTPYRNVSQLAATGLSPQFVSQIGNLCSVRSLAFEVHITAHVGGYQREYVAILFRNSVTDIQVVSFYWK